MNETAGYLAQHKLDDKNFISNVFRLHYRGQLLEPSTVARIEFTRSIEGGIILPTDQEVLEYGKELRNTEPSLSDNSLRVVLLGVKRLAAVAYPNGFNFAAQIARDLDTTERLAVDYFQKTINMPEYEADERLSIGQYL